MLSQSLFAVALTALASMSHTVEPTASLSATQAQVRANFAAHVGPLPSDIAVLDGYASRGEWTLLVKRLASATSASDILADMDWERSKVINGGNILFDIAYVNSLWKTASLLSTPGADEMKQTAVAFALYQIAVIDLDGPRCKDPTAPDRKLRLALTNWGTIVHYGQALPPQQKDTVKQVALRLEWATAPVRVNDPVLCRGGLDEMRANMEAGAKPQEVPSTPAPGMLPGKSFALPHIVDYKPEFLADAVWKPVVDARRAQLPKELTSVLTLRSPPAAVSSSLTN